MIEMAVSTFQETPQLLDGCDCEVADQGETRQDDWLIHLSPGTVFVEQFELFGNGSKPITPKQFRTCSHTKAVYSSPLVILTQKLQDKGHHGRV